MSKPKPTDQRRRVQIRWMIRRDLHETLEIEPRAFEFPWSEQDFIRELRQRNTMGMVADRDDRIVGYMIYELHKTHLHLINFAVHPEHRRDGVGRALIAKLVGKLSVQRRTRISLEVRESNLAAQLFFKAQGFRALNTLRDFYENGTEDAIVMAFRHRPDRQLHPVELKELYGPPKPPPAPVSVAPAYLWTCPTCGSRHTTLVENFFAVQEHVSCVACEGAFEPDQYLDRTACPENFR